MSEYIKREALLKDIEEERPVNWTDSEYERQAESDFYKYRDIVMMQPTADVVEVERANQLLQENKLLKQDIETLRKYIKQLQNGKKEGAEK